MTHNTKQALSLTVIAWFLAAVGLLFLAGCYEAGDDVKNITPPPPTEPVTLLIRGNCGSEFDTITCCDDSDSIPDGEIDHVFWELMSSLSRVEAQTRGDQGLCVSFAEVDVGVYDVRQTVTATDGGSKRQTIPNIVVGG